MASTSGVVTLHGRFKPGAKVALVKVAHEGVLRAEGGRTVARKRVDDQGCVRFSEGVEVGARYFIVGLIGGEPVEVRARGNAPGDEDVALVNSSVRPERQKLADGSWQDELEQPGAPRQAPDPESEEAASEDVVSGASAAKSSAGSTKAKSAKSPARKEQ